MTCPRSLCKSLPMPEIDQTRAITRLKTMDLIQADRPGFQQLLHLSRESLTNGSPPGPNIPFFKLGMVKNLFFKGLCAPDAPLCLAQSELSITDRHCIIIIIIILSCLCLRTLSPVLLELSHCTALKLDIPTLPPPPEVGAGEQVSLSEQLSHTCAGNKVLSSQKVLSLTLRVPPAQQTGICLIIRRCLSTRAEISLVGIHRGAGVTRMWASGAGRWGGKGVHKGGKVGMKAWLGTASPACHIQAWPTLGYCGKWRNLPCLPQTPLWGFIPSQHTSNFLLRGLKAEGMWIVPKDPVGALPLTQSCVHGGTE